MKKSMLFGSLLLLAAIPASLYAQEVQLPTVRISLNRDKVPIQVKEAVLKDFGDGHKPIAWVNNNSLFDTYAWEQSTLVDNLDVYTYAIHSKISDGSSLDAVYTPDGKLISSREYLKDFRPGQNIMLTLQNTEFKDWGITKDFFLRKVSSNGSGKQRYALVMQRGKEKKTLFFDTNGMITASKTGELAGELADAEW